jgi:hypothetical protein
MKKRLLEVEYEDIFKPETMAALKGKSGESLRAMLGNKTLNQTMIRSKALLDQIIEAELDYHIELEMIAEIMAREAYPILDYANVKIDAKIVGMGGVEQNTNGSEEEGEIPAVDIPEDDVDAMKKKRRIINGITQGASIRGTFGFLLFREHLDDLSPELVEKYNEIMKLVFGIYDDENAIAMMLAMLAQNKNFSGASSEMVYDEEKEQFIIKARALCFPMLFHEIIKGLYEIVGTEGFSSDIEKNKEIISKIDKISNEPRDLQYGKFIYDALSNLYNQSNIDDSRVRELFFAEVYKLDDREFITFIENVINNTLTPAQKKWAFDEMREIKSDLKKDDTGLSGLDEIKKTLNEDKISISNEYILPSSISGGKMYIQKDILSKYPEIKVDKANSIINKTDNKTYYLVTNPNKIETGRQSDSLFKTSSTRGLTPDEKLEQKRKRDKLIQNFKNELQKLGNPSKTELIKNHRDTLYRRILRAGLLDYLFPKNSIK